jgi:Protein of unknown function (DUF3050)
MTFPDPRGHIVLCEEERDASVRERCERLHRDGGGQGGPVDDWIHLCSALKVVAGLRPWRSSRELPAGCHDDVDEGVEGTSESDGARCRTPIFRRDAREFSALKTRLLPQAWRGSIERRGMPPLDRVVAKIQPLRDRLLEHHLYAEMNSPEAVRVFMEHHIFAVWDFMSLVKALQRRLTCVDVPWHPQGDRTSRRFINEIVLSEETDDDGLGGFASHFELYVSAMKQAGARTDVIEAFLELLRRGETPDEAIEHAGAPDAARRFVRSTLGVITSGSLPAIAGAFTLGREDVIPDLFCALIARLDAASPGQFERLRYYLERHIDIDASRHGPMARCLLTATCAADVDRWSEVEAAAARALEARIALWEGVVGECRKRRTAAA